MSKLRKLLEFFSVMPHLTVPQRAAWAPELGEMLTATEIREYTGIPWTEAAKVSRKRVPLRYTISSLEAMLALESHWQTYHRVDRDAFKRTIDKGSDITAIAFLTDIPRRRLNYASKILARDSRNYQNFQSLNAKQRT